MTYHLAGDSTVAPPVPAELPMTGWGSYLAAHVSEPVRNLAFGGATTESWWVTIHQPPSQFLFVIPIPLPPLTFSNSFSPSHPPYAT